MYCWFLLYDGSVYAAETRSLTLRMRKTTWHTGWGREEDGPQHGAGDDSGVGKRTSRYVCGSVSTCCSSHNVLVKIIISLPSGHSVLVLAKDEKTT